MQITDIPATFTYPFASGASGSYIRTIPVTSADPVAASELLGFPPDTFIPTTSGGTPPDGRDFNGILNQVTGWNQWQSAGGPITYDAALQTAIGGYPKGAIVQSATTFGKLWMSTADDNATDPDASGAGWTAWTFGAVGAGTVTSITAGLGLSGGTITSAGTIAMLQASTSQLGGVKVDGTTIVINGSGQISATVSGGGSVSSVGLVMPAIFNVSGSPVTTTGNLTAALATQSANTIFAGPASGGASAPTFRALVPNDLPAATASQKGAVQVDNVTTFMTGNVISASAGSGGTVTSISMTGAGTGLTFSPGTITTAGTFTLGGVLNLNFGGTGATTAAGARTNLGLGTIATQNANSVNISGGVISALTSPLPIAAGGTSTTTATGTGSVVLSNAPTLAGTLNITGGGINVTGTLVAQSEIRSAGVVSCANGTAGMSGGGGVLSWFTVPGGNNATFNGSTGVFTCVSVTQTSDARRKTGIERVGSAGLEAIRQLAGYTFTMKDGGTRGAGVIAQEVEAILPDLVSTDAGGFKSVTYSGLHAYEIEAIKEMASQVADLTARVDALTLGNC